MKGLRKTIPALLSAVSLLIFATGVAAAGRLLTLDEAVTLALTRNQEIVKAREYGKSAQGRYIEERAAALPQVGFESELAHGRDETLSMYGASPEQERRRVGLNLTQPIYTWGKVDAAVRGAEQGLLTAGDRLRQAGQKTRLDVTTAFHDVILAKELHNLAVRNLSQKNRRLDEAERKLAAGIVTDYDVLAARVAMENSRPETIRAENQIRINQDRLRFLLSLDEEVDAAGQLQPLITPTPTFDAALALAVNKRPELADLRHRIGMFEEIATIAKTGLKPRLDFKASAGWQDLGEADGTVWNAGLLFSWPLFDGRRTDGKVAQAESDVRGLQADERKLLDAIALETREAVNAVREAEEILQALAGTVTQAERLFSMAETGFALGVKIRLEVEDAELNLLQAKSNLAKAQRDYLVARTKLAWATGTLEDEKK